MDLTPRIADRLNRHFKVAEREQARYLLQSVELPLYHHSPQADERIQAAMLVMAHGNLPRLLDAAALAEMDWRDVLVNAGFANEDWPLRVEAFFASSLT